MYDVLVWVQMCLGSSLSCAGGGGLCYVLCGFSFSLILATTKMSHKNQKQPSAKIVHPTNFLYLNTRFIRGANGCAWMWNIPAIEASVCCLFFFFACVCCLGDCFCFSALVFLWIARIRIFPRVPALGS